jgi:hypothetical protein
MAASIAFAVIVVMGGMRDSFGLYVITHGFGTLCGAGFITAMALEMANDFCSGKFRSVPSAPSFAVALAIGFAAPFCLFLLDVADPAVRIRFIGYLIPMVLAAGSLAGAMGYADRRGLVW